MLFEPKQIIRYELQLLAHYGQIMLFEPEY